MKVKRQLRIESIKQSKNQLTQTVVESEQNHKLRKSALQRNLEESEIKQNKVEQTDLVQRKYALTGIFAIPSSSLGTRA